MAGKKRRGTVTAVPVRLLAIHRQKEEKRLLDTLF